MFKTVNLACIFREQRLLHAGWHVNLKIRWLGVA
jgi:hypothetical protein